MTIHVKNTPAEDFSLPAVLEAPFAWDEFDSETAVVCLGESQCELEFQIFPLLQKQLPSDCLYEVHDCFFSQSYGLQKFA